MNLGAYKLSVLNGHINFLINLKYSRNVPHYYFYSLPRYTYTVFAYDDSKPVEYEGSVHI